MPDPSLKTSSPEPESLSRQDVFQEINTELISGNRLTAPRQKTLPNYTQVLLLNLLLITLAGLGIFTVYRIFREQGIRLTVGTGAIQSLELLLIEQEARRKNEEILQKEAALRLAQQETALVAQELQNVLSDISNQANMELERQRSNLTANIQRELQGKSAAERAAIQEQYNKELARLQSEANAEIKRRADEAARLQQEKLLKLKEESARIQEELRTANRAQPAPPRQDTAPAYAPQYSDNGVSALFNSIDRQLRAGNFAEAERIIQNIEMVYQRDKTTPPEKRSADLFMASLIRNYISLYNSNQPAASGNAQESDMAAFREMIAEISTLASKNPKDPIVAQKIRALEAGSPDVFIFFDAYRKYLAARESTRAAPAIASAGRAYTEKDYKAAAEQYRNILVDYPNIPEQESILRNYSASISQLSQKGIPYSTGGGVIYLKAPYAYILDITEDTAVLSLMPGVVLKPGKRINIFRINSDSNLQLSAIGEARITEAKGTYALASLSEANARIGDLIYLKD